MAVNNDNTLFDPYAPPTGTTPLNLFPNTTLYFMGGVQPGLDPPTNLAASVTGQNVHLTWDAPSSGGNEFFEGFESGTLPTGWLAIDNDGDGFNWINVIEQGFGFEAHTGLGAMTSASYDNTAGALTPDNWLITPAIQVTATSQLNYWHSAQDPDWADEHYYIKVSTTTPDLASFTNTIFDGVTPQTWAENTIDLSAFAGQTIYIAFEHCEVTDMFWMKLDDITVTNTATRSIATPKIAPIHNQGYAFKTKGLNPKQIEAKKLAYNNHAKSSRGLLGYNAYRDDTKLNTSVITDLFYDDMNVAPGTYNYTTTAVYDEGESVHTSPVEVTIASSNPNIYATDFESFTAGGQVACQDPVNWTTWSNAPCGTEDAYISTDFAHGGVNAVKDELVNDLVLPMGNKTAGKYEFSFWMYIPTNHGGYYNLLHNFAGSSSEWGLEFYFTDAGSADLHAGGVVTSVPYTHDQWFKVKNEIDLDADQAKVYLDDVLVYTWQWSLDPTNGTAGLDQLQPLTSYQEAALRVSLTPCIIFIR